MTVTVILSETFLLIMGLKLLLDWIKRKSETKNSTERKCVQSSLIFASSSPISPIHGLRENIKPVPDPGINKVMPEEIKQPEPSVLQSFQDHGKKRDKMLQFNGKVKVLYFNINEEPKTIDRNRECIIQIRYKSKQSKSSLYSYN